MDDMTKIILDRIKTLEQRINSRLDDINNNMVKEVSCKERQKSCKESFSKKYFYQLIGALGVIITIIIALKEL